MRRTAAVIALLIVPLLALSGCTPAPPVASETPTPSGRPLFANEDEALKAATEAYAAYLKVSDEILVDGGKDPDRIRSVASGEQLAANLKGYQKARDEGLKSTGGTTFDRVAVQQVGDGAKNAVLVYLCEDLATVDVFNGDGVSIVSATRPDRSGYEVAFDYVSGHAATLKVASKTPWSDYSC